MADNAKNVDARRQATGGPSGRRRGVGSWDPTEGGEGVVESFYADKFSSEERSRLTKATSDDLEDAINLVKVTIRRKLSEKTDAGDSGAGAETELGPGGDAEAIRRLVDTLCRLIKARSSLAGKEAKGIEGEMSTALKEILDELRIEQEQEANANVLER